MNTRLLPLLCSKCGQPIVKTNSFSTGYGVNTQGDKVCYACCGKVDSDELVNLPIGGRATLYLTIENGTYRIVNWPSTLVIKVSHYSKSFHNFCGRNGRTDVWFYHRGHSFHGYQIGNFTEICHIRKIKSLN